jgi:hypothetical protein
VYEVIFDKTKWLIYAIYKPPSMANDIFTNHMNILLENGSKFIGNSMKLLMCEPSEDNDRELISAFSNELSKNESVNLKELHSPHSHGSSEILNDIYSVGETLAHLMWLR